MTWLCGCRRRRWCTLRPNISGTGADRNRCLAMLIRYGIGATCRLVPRTRGVLSLEGVGECLERLLVISKKIAVQFDTTILVGHEISTNSRGERGWLKQRHDHLHMSTLSSYIHS